MWGRLEERTFLLSGSTPVKMGQVLLATERRQCARDLGFGYRQTTNGVFTTKLLQSWL